MLLMEANRRSAEGTQMAGDLLCSKLRPDSTLRADLKHLAVVAQNLQLVQNLQLAANYGQ